MIYMDGQVLLEEVLALLLSCLEQHFCTDELTRWDPIAKIKDVTMPSALHIKK